MRLVNKTLHALREYCTGLTAFDVDDLKIEIITKYPKSLVIIILANNVQFLMHCFLICLALHFVLQCFTGESQCNFNVDLFFG